MGWNYQAQKTVYKTSEDHEETLFELVEAYPDMEPLKDGTPCRTEETVIPYGESQQNLADWLRKAADDVENFPIIDNGIVYMPKKGRGE